MNDEISKEEKGGQTPLSEPLIENSEDHSICEVLEFDEDKFTVIPAATVVDFLQGSMPIIYKLERNKIVYYYSILTDSVVLRCTIKNLVE